MGWLDRILGTVRSPVAREAGKYAAKKAVKTAKGKVEALGAELRQLAEGDDADADDSTSPEQDVVERVRVQTIEERQARKQARIDRERRAREELAALKAAAHDGETD